MGNKVRYCTWARSEESPELALLLDSARKFGIAIDIISCTGFLDKPATLLRYIAGLDDNDLVLATDGYDVLYAQPEQAILNAFQRLGTAIVFGGETGCYHHFSDSRAFFERNPQAGPYRYLNSGMIMGNVCDLRRMLEHYMKLRKPLRIEYRSAEKTPGFFNDQTILGRVVCNTDYIKVDANAELFCTFTDEKFDINAHAILSADGIKITETSTWPCLVHVSHREKFYSVYLYIAHQLGLELIPDNLDWRLIRSYLNSLGGRTSGHRSINMDAEFKQQVSRMWEEQKRRTYNCDHVGIIFIGTGKYIHYFENFHEAVSKRFLPGIRKTFFVFTDAVGPELFQYSNVIPIPTPAQKWPFPTLFRFSYLESTYHHWCDTSHIVYFDADTLIHTDIYAYEMFSPEKPLLGVRHPGLFSKKSAPFEKNPRSRAYVNESEALDIYWQGCLWGGRTDQVLKLCRELSSRINQDLADDIIARWHDESHLNKYYLENKHLVHTLHPGFAYPQAFGNKFGYEKKVTHLDKNHSYMRKIEPA